MLRSGIYMIVNDATGMFYIGSASIFSKRFGNHRDELRRNKHCNSYLQRAWNKYGEENFRFIIVQRVSKLELLKYEQLWLDWTKSYDNKIGYNLNAYANSNFGRVWNEKARANMSAAQKGRKLTEEQKINKVGFKAGHIPTKETCLKISEALVGKTFSNAHKVKLSLSRRNVLKRRMAANALGVLSMGC